MKKEELIAAIRAAKGIPEPEGKKERQVFVKKEKVVLTAAELKKKVKELRLKREEALQQHNWKLAEILRKRISRTKKMTRRTGVSPRNLEKRIVRDRSRHSVEFGVIKGLKIELTKSLENLPSPLFIKEGNSSL